ncbi:hypothetical protein [Holospora curviuscula]|uniref:Uncharacterized protein n=1 Tax=Holospora curviuscula TaxID=1082868 RepID=A0A2S5R6Q4_9PROT|nr:hypothetical protein [Holospora curviuscula]PPE02994.1 hypothetical protein HCUR_01575 [Holospora curviuscula]
MSKKLLIFSDPMCLFRGSYRNPIFKVHDASDNLKLEGVTCTLIALDKDFQGCYSTKMRSTM